VDIGAHHTHLVVFLRQVVQQDVAYRNNALQLVTLANQQVTKTVPSHEKAAGFHVLPWTDGEGILGHDIADTGAGWVEALDYNSAHKIAFGKHARQYAVLHDGDSADVTVNHGTGYIKHRLSDVSAIGLLRFD